MTELPFFPALICPRCYTAHDFYVPAHNELPFGPNALYVYQCPATELPGLIAPGAAPRSPTSCRSTRCR